MFYSAILLTGVNLLLRFVSTSFQVYLSGRIGASGVGLLQLVMTVGGMSMTAGMAGIRTATMYLTAEELGKKQAGNIHWVLKGCFLYSLVCSGIVGGAVYSAAPSLAENWIGDVRTVSAVRMFAVCLPVTCLCGMMTGYFTAANRIGTLAAVEVAEQIFTMVITVAGLSLWAGHDSAKSCQCVVFGSCAGVCLTFTVLLILRMIERNEPAPRIPIASRLFHAAVPLALADNLKAGINTVENLMVPKRLAQYPYATNPLALFGTVSGMVFPVMMFPAAILFGLAELLIPELARCNAAGSKARIHYLVKRSLRVAMLYGCFFCGLLFLFADSLCLTLYQNAQAGEYLKRFSLMIPILYCDTITDAMIKGLGQQKISVRYNILTSCIDVGLLYLLLPQYGIGGYFVSFLITHLINFGLSLRRLLKITGQRLPILIPITCSCAVATAIILCLSIQTTILRGISFVAILGSLLTLLQILSKEDIRWITGLVRKK